MVTSEKKLSNLEGNTIATHLELIEAALAEYLRVLPVYDDVTGHQVHTELTPGSQTPGNQSEVSIEVT